MFKNFISLISSYRAENTRLLDLCDIQDNTDTENTSLLDLCDIQDNADTKNKKYLSKIRKIYHMTSIDNLETIFNYGLQNHYNPYKKTDISNQEVNSRREKRENIYNRKIHEYVNFYFNPKNAMQYHNKNRKIVILGYSIEIIKDNLDNNVVFANQNASTNRCLFFNKISSLLNQKYWDFDLIFHQGFWFVDNIEKLTRTSLAENLWEQVDDYRFKDKHLMHSMQAEILINAQAIPKKYIKTIYCKDEITVNMINDKFNLDGIVVKCTPKLFY